MPLSGEVTVAQATKADEASSQPVRIDFPETIIDAVGSAICVLNPQGRIIQWNRGASALTGFTRDELQGRFFRDEILFSCDLERWEREIQSIFAGMDAARFDCRWRLKNGGVKELDCHCTAIRNESDGLRAIVCNAHDAAPQIERLTRELVEDRFAEMRAVSRFFHDTVSQDLVALSFKIGELELVATQARGQRPEGISDYVLDHSCRNMRLASQMVAPPSLSAISLEDALMCYAAQISEESGLGVVAEVDSTPNYLSAEAQLLLFAAVQELATHGIRIAAQAKTAEAKLAEAKLMVRLENSSAGTVLRLEMIPPAVIHPSTANQSSLGPVPGWALIRARMQALGGSFEWSSNSAEAGATLSFPAANQ